MKKEKLLVSSCLLGELVKYNGSHNLIDKRIIEKLEDCFELYPFCPEVEGGLEIPRVPCEIVSNEPLKILNKNGEDKTKEFVKGADLALKLSKKEKIKKALLKANSPSCGNHYIYDGTFSSKKVKGEGVTSKLLSKEGIKVYNENEIEELFI